MDCADVSFLPFWIAIKKATHTLTSIQMRRAFGAGSSATVTELGSRQLGGGFQQLDIVGFADLVGELFLSDKLPSSRVSARNRAPSLTALSSSNVSRKSLGKSVNTATALATRFDIDRCSRCAISRARPAIVSSRFVEMVADTIHPVSMETIYTRYF
jgi:hypothetical protein